MNKQQIIETLNAQGTTFDPASTKAELEALLKSSSVPAGDGAAAPPAATAEPAAGAAPPAADKPEAFPSAETADVMDAIIAGGAPATDALGEFPAGRETLPESEILEKVRAGLTREQAVEVINAQREHDGKPRLSAAELEAAGDDAGDIPESEIAGKVRAGLTRNQAIEVIHNQREHDKAAAL